MKLFNPMKDKTEQIPEDIKQYQDDIKAGVDVSGKIKGTKESVCNDCYDDGFKGSPCPHIEVIDKTEQIREEFYKEKCSQEDDAFLIYENNPEDIADWWLSKLAKEYQRGREDAIEQLSKVLRNPPPIPKNAKLNEIKYNDN